MTQHFPKWPLWASLIAYFLLTAALIATVPLGASPDEAAHWLYVEHLAQTGHLPVFNAVPHTPGYEFHQPPLYYALCAPLWKLLGAGVQNYACRVVSMLCGLATIAVVWGAARLLFPREWRIAALAAGFAALWPLNQAVGAGNNNDGLAALVCSLLFYLVARLWMYGPTWRDCWQLGLVIGFGILTKNTTLSVAAASAAALFWAANRSENESAPRPVLAVAVALGVALLIGGPLLLRNQLVYGDVLVQRAFKAAFRATSPGPNEFALMGIDGATYVRSLLIVAFCTAWGFFGGPNTVNTATHLFARQPIWPRPDLLPLLAVCLFFPLLCLLGWRRTDVGALTERGGIKALQSYALGALFVALAWAQFAAQYFAGAQARYGHVALLPVCVFLAVGWVGFWGRGRALAVASVIVGAVLVALTLLNVFGWKTLV